MYSSIDNDQKPSCFLTVNYDLLQILYKINIVVSKEKLSFTSTTARLIVVEVVINMTFASFIVHKIFGLLNENKKCYLLTSLLITFSIFHDDYFFRNTLYVSYNFCFLYYLVGCSPYIQRINVFFALPKYRPVFLFAAKSDNGTSTNFQR